MKINWTRATVYTFVKVNPALLSNVHAVLVWDFCYVVEAHI